MRKSVTTSLIASAGILAMAGRLACLNITNLTATSRSPFNPGVFTVPPSMAYKVNIKIQTRFFRYRIYTQSAITCSKLTKETLQQGVKYV